MFECVKQRFESQATQGQEIQLPMFEYQDIDDMFCLKPSVINEQIELINSRHLSTMDLASKTQEAVKSLSNRSSEQIDFSHDAHEALIGSGVLYGYIIADKSTDEFEPETRPDEAVIDSLKGLVGENYSPIDAFAKLREIEIEHFGSDILSISLSSAQDHILDIAGDEGLVDQSQVVFYGGVLIGAISRLPNPDVKKRFSLRDTFNPDNIDNYFPAVVQHDSSDRYEHLDVARDLENGLRIRKKGRKIEMINSKLVQIAPNIQHFYKMEEVAINAKDIEIVITGKAYPEEGNYVLKANRDIDDIDENQSIVGVVLRVNEGKLKKSKNGLITTYNEGHPYYERLIGFASDNVKAIDYIGAHDFAHKSDGRQRMPVKTMGVIVLAEHIAFPDVKQTTVLLGGLGVLAAGQKVHNHILETNP